MAKAPRLDPLEVEKQLEERSRRPFRAIMARILECAPSPEAIALQAERYPDRWGQLAAMFAKLSGYSDKLEIEGSMSLKINDLSDSELERRLQELRTLDSQSSQPQPE